MKHKLGYQTERGGTLIETRSGGRTELLGGFAYSTSGSRIDPMFSLREAAGSFILRESGFNGMSYQILVSETRHGQNKILGKDDVPRRHGGGLLTLGWEAPNELPKHHPRDTVPSLTPELVLKPKQDVESFSKNPTL